MDKERVTLTSGVFYCETKKEKKGFQETKTNKDFFFLLKDLELSLEYEKVEWIN